MSKYAKPSSPAQSAFHPIPATTVLRALEAAKVAHTTLVTEDGEQVLSVEPFWHRDVLSYEFGRINKAGEGTLWAHVQFRENIASAWKSLNLKVFGEFSAGGPMKDKAGGPMKVLDADGKEKKTNKIGAEFKKYKNGPKTADDKFTIITPASEAPENLSVLYAVADLLDEAFQAECGLRITRGEQLLGIISGSKNIAEAAAAVAAYNAEHPRSLNDSFISETDLAKALKGYKAKPTPADLAPLMLNTLRCMSTVPRSLCQREYSTNCPMIDARGMPMPNPVTRVNVVFEGKQVTKILDKKKKVTTAGAADPFEAATHSGSPITFDNFYDFFTFRSTCDGIARLCDVCFSASGISMPMRFTLLVVDSYERVDTNSANVLYEGMDAGDGENYYTAEADQDDAIAADPGEGTSSGAAPTAEQMMADLLIDDAPAE